MNRIAKLLLIGAMLLTLPIRYFAQNSRTVYNQETIEFDITDISLFDERIYFIYNLVNDSRFDIKVSEEDGIFLINANEAFENMNLEDSFLDFCHQNNATFRQMDKAAAANVAYECKSHIPSEMFASLMMDYYIRSRQNSTCATADPFCTDQDAYQFPAGVNAGSGESGPDYDCLYTTPNPAWYYMQIDNPGNIDIYMYSTPGEDIDFCCWGPFDDPVSPCPYGLTTNKVVSCSYSAQPTEHCMIPSTSQHDDYFILVITNFSNDPCNITFSKVAGTGTTNCGIMPPLVDNGGPYCVGETISLTANSDGQAGATFSWTGPGGFSSTQQNPTRPNCTMAMAGTYTCTITIGSHTNQAPTEVVVNPQPTANFTFTSVCQGTATQFTSTSTTNPSGQPMTYQWNFGDGGTSTQQNPTHTYAQAGNYPVTLTVKNPNGTCSSQKQQTVPVYAMPSATASANPTTVQYNGASQLSASAGVGGQFNFQWEPANLVLNPNSQNTLTVGLQQTTTFTVTITNTQGGCSSTAQVIVSMEGSSLTATATASPAVICEGETTTLHAIASGGVPNYSYSWSPTNSLNNPNIANPVATPPVGTTHYTCQVSDGITTQNVSVDVLVNPITETHTTVSICPDETYDFHGTPINEPNEYTYTSTNEYGCDEHEYLTLQHYETYDETTYTEFICYGEQYDFFGTLYDHNCSPENVFVILPTTTHQCDSIVRLDLTVYPANDTTIIDPTICVNQNYNFHGTLYYNDGDTAYFDTTDIHGCLKVEKLILSVGEYQMPPVEEKYICYGYDEQPSFTWDKNGQEYTHDDDDEVILPDPAGGCDFKYRLKVRFHENAYHVDNKTSCDTYTWPVNNISYDQTDTYTATFPTTDPNFADCGVDTYVLNLTITEHDEEYRDLNDESEEDYDPANTCDEYFWDPKGKDYWDYKYQGQSYSGGETLSQSGTYQRTYKNSQDCDSIQTLKVLFEYTPNPTDSIMSPDVNIGVAPHNVITASEFQINTYDFTIHEQGFATEWETVTWTLKDQYGNDVDWDLDYSEGNGQNLRLTVFQYVPGRLYLTATASNRCGTVSRTHWLECTFYGIEEQCESLSNVDIVPNPNNGEMTLNFEYLTGKVNIKVYDMKGNLIDDFETYNSVGPNSMKYDMKGYADGMYFFVIAAKEGTVTKKVIIEK